MVNEGATPATVRAARIGFVSSISLAVLTFTALAFAMRAVPPSGPYCSSDCMSYPFADILTYFPRDYVWMYLACFQVCVFLVFAISLHFRTDDARKILSYTGVAFATLATGVLLITYFVQFSVVPASAHRGQTDGIALLTQYNGEGIFIAMEELGFLLMSIAFFALAFTYTRRNALERSIRVVFFAPLVLVAVLFIAYNVAYGFDLSYRFEVAAITVDWLACIVAGILASVAFRRTLRGKA